MGFAFFTIATVLGALWAAEAWGGYWSWDPEGNLGADRLAELCILAAHAPDEGPARRGPAWWALVGLAVTTFAFLG